MILSQQQVKLDLGARIIDRVGEWNGSSPLVTFPMEELAPIAQ